MQRTTSWKHQHPTWRASGRLVSISYWLLFVIDTSIRFLDISARSPSAWMFFRPSRARMGPSVKTAKRFACVGESISRNCKRVEIQDQPSSCNLQCRPMIGNYLAMLARYRTCLSLPTPGVQGKPGKASSGDAIPHELGLACPSLLADKPFTCVAQA